jgi:hypothetical protein
VLIEVLRDFRLLLPPIDAAAADARACASARCGRLRGAHRRLLPRRSPASGKRLGGSARVSASGQADRLQTRSSWAGAAGRDRPRRAVGSALGREPLAPATARS